MNTTKTLDTLDTQHSDEQVQVCQRLGLRRGLGHGPRTDAHGAR